MIFQSFVARQLARPSGLVGRLFTARWLEKANAGMNSLALEALALGANDRLLELGFGSGYLLERVLANRLCAQVAGIDLSPEMVTLVSRRLRRHIEAGRAEIRLGDIESIPYADGGFSKVCSVNTLYFWKNPPLALAECRRVLATGGRLALCFNDKDAMARWPGHAHGFTLYEVGEVTQMLAAGGFSAIATSSADDARQGLFHCVTGIAA